MHTRRDFTRPDVHFFHVHLRFVTVFAAECDEDGPSLTIPRFSNPAVSYRGRTTGTNTANNARTIKDNVVRIPDVAPYGAKIEHILRIAWICLLPRSAAAHAQTNGMQWPPLPCRPRVDSTSDERSITPHRTVTDSHLPLLPLETSLYARIVARPLFPTSGTSAQVRALPSCKCSAKT